MNSVFIRACNLDGSDYVVIPCLASQKSTTFLVDSQSDISIIKVDSLSDLSYINTKNITKIVGVKQGSLRTLGTINTFLMPDSDKQLNTKFHVVDSSFPIPVDGIIGKDLIKMYNCCLDYLCLEFSIRSSGKVIKVPIRDHSLSDTYHLIPSRCEVIRQFRLITTSSEDVIVNKQEIFTGLFIAIAIVNPSNFFLRLLNTH